MDGMVVVSILLVLSLFAVFLAGMLAQEERNIVPVSILLLIGCVFVCIAVLIAKDIPTGAAAAENSLNKDTIYEIVSAGENYATLRPYYGDGETRLYKLKTTLPSPAPACVVRIEKGDDASLQAVSCPAPIKPAAE